MVVMVMMMMVRYQIQEAGDREGVTRIETLGDIRLTLTTLRYIDRYNVN